MLLLELFLQTGSPDGASFFLRRIYIKLAAKNLPDNGELTLTLEEATIKKAKSYAKNTGRSLSKLVESYLKTLTDGPYDKSELSPTLRKIVGAVKLPNDFDGRKALYTYFENKHK